VGYLKLEGQDIQIMEAAKIEDPLSQVLDIFDSLGDSLNILAEETTPEKVVIEPLEEVIETFGQLGDSLNVLNDDAIRMFEDEPLEEIMETFGQLGEHLNTFSETVNGNLEIIEPLEESLDAFDPVESLQSFTEAVTENIKVVTTIATDENETQEGSTSPIVQVMNWFGHLWESLAGISESEDPESSEQTSPSASPWPYHLSDSDVHLLLILVSALLFLMVVSCFICSYCKRKMWERGQWREVEHEDSDSDCSGSWISIDSSTQVTPMITPTKDQLEAYWFRPDISPSIIV